MAAAEILSSSPAPAPVRPARERTASWPLVDRLAYLLCWVTGIGLCVIAAAIVLFMLIKGIAYLHLSMFVRSPQPSLLQKQSGGFRDPILGTLLITTIGIGIAAPTGVAVAAWLSEYARPRWLAQAVESAVEMVAGTPSVVLALFGLLIFSQSFLGFLSQHAATGSVTGSSFLTAGAVMSILALPLIVTSTRAALAQLPDRLREASYALGKTRATTIRRVLLPSIRPGIGTGVVLGMGRIIGDTAIITIVLGGRRTRSNRPATCRSSACCAASARRSPATSTTSPPPARATRREGVRRGVRAADDRACAERPRDTARAGATRPRDRRPRMAARPASRGAAMEAMMPPPIRRIALGPRANRRPRAPASLDNERTAGLHGEPAAHA